jgi:hypothetical protein
MRRRDELAAYRRAGVHMFYLPGEAKVAVLVELVSVSLTEICTATSSRNAKLCMVRDTRRTEGTDSTGVSTEAHMRFRRSTDTDEWPGARLNADLPISVPSPPDRSRTTWHFVGRSYVEEALKASKALELLDSSLDRCLTRIDE